MSRFKASIKKWLYNRLPLVGGSYRYCGTRLHFPKRSQAFDLLADEGIYESEILHLIVGRLRPDSMFLDVGANLGMISVPVLAFRPDVRVLALEPSPNSLPYLQRTHAGSPHRERWTVIGKAAASTSGTARFTVSEPHSAGYDGLRHTGRATRRTEVEVELTTLDAEWLALGQPQVSCIKMDIEGAEMGALGGATGIIQRDRPVLFLEWYAPNFSFFDVNHGDLLQFAQRWSYQVLSIPGLFAMTTEAHLDIVTARHGNVVLVPEA